MADAAPQTNGETLQAGFGRFSLAAKGPVVIILLSLYGGIALDIYFAAQIESVRRIVEAEARLEVSTIKAAQQVILQSVSRYCGVPGLDAELERIQIEYKQRRDYINSARDKLGIPRISPPSVRSPSEPERERDR